MINADHNITIFNLRIDKKTRREVFVPTGISGVSFYDVHKVSVASRMGETARTEELAFKIRIPLDAEVQSKRTYLPESQYNGLSDEEALKYWTIQKGCYVFGATVESDMEFITKDELDKLISSADSDEFIIVKEYVDNTKRGTDAVKHWRIGGA